MTVMLLARERGLHTCAQEAWSQFYATTRRVLRIPEDEMIFCGLALGFIVLLLMWRCSRHGAVACLNGTSRDPVQVGRPGCA